MFLGIIFLSSLDSFSQVADITKGCAPLKVNFTAPSTSTTYFWDFKDGVTSNLQNPANIFGKVGIYNVTFRETVGGPILKTIKIEVERVNKSGLIDVVFSIDGEHYSLSSQPELVLFRIFQEALNNVLKYSAAKQLNIRLQYHVELFTLTLEDNGVGFSSELLKSNSGSGIKNIINRAALIGGTATIASSPGKGCRIEVALNPSKKQYYSDGGIYQNRFS